MNKTFEVYLEDKNYRNDIQGIRAIGAMLVLVFHIWFQKVSGGVDVFFVVSGFLMTGLLLRQYSREETLKPLQFWGGIIKRVAPSAYIVLLVTLFFSYFFISPVYWEAVINEFVFSAAHLENLLLIRREVDYLKREEPASPFQQFWALSIQVQFYAFLPFLLGPLVYVSNKMKSLRPLVIGVSLVVFFSFIYSLISTSSRPETAYFNPFGRVWEFLSGALVAILVPYLKVNKKLASILSFLGVLMLVSVGVVIPREWSFPGYVALFPVMSAIFLIVSGGGSEGSTVVNKLLSNKYLVVLGAMSFTIYLWHWPILIFFQNYYETTSLGFVKGMMVILLGILLAIFTTMLLERPFRNIPKTKTLLSYTVGFLFFITFGNTGPGGQVLF
ncbi:acyltransferase [Halomonas sp. Bachu 37]|uniref:acyltransferase family protein n=1 Tax=Halomonas kashgarensis TaxID=3084920 RepID=UPI003217D77B